MLTNKNKNNSTFITGANGSAKSYYLAKCLKIELDKDSKKQKLNLIVVPDKKVADELYEDLNFFGLHTELYPTFDTFPFETLSPSVYVTAQRLKVITKIVQNEQTVVIAPVNALFQRVFSANYINNIVFILKIGLKIQKDELVKKIINLGYLQTSIVQEVGDFAVRGKIIDIYTSDFAYPLRVELINDGEKRNEIKDIRFFNIDDQRSREDGEISNFKDFNIKPVREFFPLDKLTEEDKAKIIKRSNECEFRQNEAEKIIQQIEKGSYFPGLEVYQSIYCDSKVGFFDLIAKDIGINLILDNPTMIENAIDHYEDQLKDRHNKYLNEQFLVPKIEDIYLERETVASGISEKVNYFFDTLPIFNTDSNEDSKSLSKEIKVKSRFLTQEHLNLKAKKLESRADDYLKNYFENKVATGYKVVVVLGADSRTDRFINLCKNFRPEPWVFSGKFSEWILQTNPNPFVIINGKISKGVELTDEKILIISEQELFGERIVKKKSRTAKNLKKLMSLLSNLSEDDFLVHADYGIGKYKGLEHKEIEGKINDFIVIQYLDSKLYLPVANIGKIQKYFATEGQNPIVDKLGGTRWIKTKSKLKRSLEIIAGELLKLYAERKVVRGWRYDPWGAIDEDFAESFPFSETEDQLNAINETIEDMSQDVPMERLICGDVGFGKTEIAIRAAFKAFQHKKQVALLVPTTLLAEQHYRNFVERFADYSVNIGCVSRLRTARKGSVPCNNEVVEKLQTGELDIVIGTHRVLSKDVIFNDLGLLIIDEEHRFGVKQKEKVKKYKKDIDVLTLTATPIPRTLHMSLVGIRDISILSTPPVDRKTIRTHVTRSDDALIRDAILREIERGGQCFYVRPKIEGIVSTAEYIKELVPNAKVAFAHGQMQERELEEVMNKFINREYDVLISTTIVESGIDIPTANTIMIERADMFGLAQLYQLRGRVGRCETQAYCYFLIPKNHKLTFQAEQRLKALQSLDELGIGFQLALRDMEIRGVGNLLGKEQSGEILSVGYELYMKILQEAIANLKGDEDSIRNSIDPELKFYVSAFIPDEYIPDISERLILYQRLSSLEYSLEHSSETNNKSEIISLREEIEDRFGPMPPEVRDLLYIMEFKAVIRYFEVIKCEYSDEKIVFQLNPAGKFNILNIQKLIASNPVKYRFSKGLQLTVFFDNKAIDLEYLKEFAIELLSKVR